MRGRIWAARALRSSGSLVITVAPVGDATTTTCASTTSNVADFASNAPTGWAWTGSKPTMSQPRRKRRSCTCRGERLAWATTGAVATGTMPASSRRDDRPRCDGRRGLRQSRRQCHRWSSCRPFAEGASSRATRRRAAAISSGVNAPLRRSHSATAARPSRTTRARRAASVIQADTLTPSWAAAQRRLRAHQDRQ